MPIRPKPIIFLAAPVPQLHFLDSYGFSLAAFLALTAANAFLAYWEPSTVAILWAGFLDLSVLVMYFLLARAPASSALGAESLPPISAWVAAPFLGLAVFTRFFHLTSLSSWPTVDEGMFGYLAIQQSERWNWNLFHGPSTASALYSWLLSFLGGAFGYSLSTIWFFPALLSLACVLLVWLACRRLFTPSLSALAAGGMAFSFWPVYMGRFSIPSILMLFWECLVFLILADFIFSVKKFPGTPKIFLLAAATGIGFYTYTAWPLVATLVGLTIAASAGPGTSGRLKALAKFSLVLLPLLAPFFLAYTRNYHGYLWHLWSWGTPRDLRTWAHVPLAYLEDFFWGKNGGAFCFGPVWGGLLNPLSTSLFFFAVLFLFRAFRHPLSRWLALAFALFCLPIFLTNNLEMMRLTPLVPLFVLICALGLHYLLLTFPSSKRLLVFAVVMASSYVLDGYHLFVQYPGHWSRHPAYYDHNKSLEYYRAYTLLKSRSLSGSKGLILLNGLPDTLDQSLFVATYSFNAAANPRLQVEDARWAAILTNIHERSYLTRDFPGGSWSWVSEGLNRADGGLLLGVIPINSGNRDRLLRWVQADRSLAPLTRLNVELGVDPDQSSFLEVLQKAYPFFEGDPLLESRYWRIAALHQCAMGDLAGGIADYQKAIQQGYPQAQLFNELGCLWYQRKDWTEAGRAFERAARSNPNFTGAEENLRNLLLLRQGKLSEK